MSFNIKTEQNDLLKFKQCIATCYKQISNYQDPSVLLRYIDNLCEKNLNNFSLDLLMKFDYICVCQTRFLPNFNLFKQYSDDYSFRYNQAVRVESILQSSLNNKNDLYYSEFLDNGSFHPEDYDKNGLLLDPARKFMNEQKNIYDEKQEYELVDLSPAQKDNIDLLLELRKRIITKAEDLYLGKQFDYMEKCLQDRELRQVEPFINYEKVKTENLAKVMEILAHANAKDLFARDKNEPLPKLMPISQDSILKSNGNSYIFDLDNFEWTNKQGKVVDPKDVLTLKKILLYLRKDLLKLINSNSLGQGR